MVNHILKSLIVMIFFVLVFTGCATTKNLFSKEEYIKKTVPHQKTYFRQVWAVVDDGDFRVSGKLRLKGTIGNHIPEYVKVDLIDMAGTVIETRKVGYIPKTLTGRPRHREARFTAHFTEPPPPGTTIRLSNVK